MVQMHDFSFGLESHHPGLSGEPFSDLQGCMLSLPGLSGEPGQRPYTLYNILYLIYDT